MLFLFDYVNALLSAHILQDSGPDGGADFAEVSLLEQQHEGAGLADATADAQRNLIV